MLSEFGIAMEFAAEAPARNAVRFMIDSSLPEEGYRLRIEPRGITISGWPAGLFYGAQSLLQLAAAHRQASSHCRRLKYMISLAFPIAACIWTRRATCSQWNF